MGETLREAAVSVARTVKQTFVFSGRARRLDIVYFWIASIIVTGALAPTVTSQLEGASAAIARKVIELVAFFPFFALFARRLHDQGRAAWWTLILPPLVAANVYESVRLNFHPFDPAWPELGIWKLGLVAAVGLSAVFMFLPGDVDENRYGPDPRLSETEPRMA